MVAYAARIMRHAGVATNEAEQRAEDVVHEAFIYHARKGEYREPAFVGAVNFYARVSARDHVISVRAPEGMKRGRITGTFPNQIFGCELANAFQPATGDDGGAHE